MNSVAPEPLTIDFSVVPTSPDLDTLFSAFSTPDDWEAAFSGLDANDVYRLTLGWASGVIPYRERSDAAIAGAVRWLRRKINAEIESRERFSKTCASDDHAALFDRPGRLPMRPFNAFYSITFHLAFGVIERRVESCAGTGRTSADGIATHGRMCSVFYWHG